MQDQFPGIVYSIFLDIILDLLQKQVHHWKEHENLGLEST